MKIVINTEYGGFGLSESAIERYVELTGKRRKSWYDIPRTDKYLIQVVEELGKEACDLFSHLEIEDIKKGTLYRIVSNDGLETIECKDPDEGWHLAK